MICERVYKVAKRDQTTKLYIAALTKTENTWNFAIKEQLSATKFEANSKVLQPKSATKSVDSDVIIAKFPIYSELRNLY